MCHSLRGFITLNDQLGILKKCTAVHRHIASATVCAWEGSLARVRASQEPAWPVSAAAYASETCMHPEWLIQDESAFDQADKDCMQLHVICS